ncbi:MULTISPECIES: hypothetical protein [Brevibacillus]|uniref:hypothetical protein n=1 Tax=Brevibacillus TaxID=55080 RepID=UPI000EEECF9F|nr:MULTISPECIES: hypothetical protein [Brevibacillus]MED2255407.1 hypothetical protein [Brevibacillus parabrevis]HBZ79064.1 hypothetical protein [Brevibacillus sp.]
MWTRRLLFFALVALVLPNFVHAATPQSAKPATPNPEQVIGWINASAKNLVALPNFDFQLANLDDDADWEIVAKQNSTVHLGTFYILDQKADRTYSLVAEKPWNVPHLQLERWDFSSERNHPQLDPHASDDSAEVAGKRLFETIDHTGGTGISAYEAHLWYMEKGKLVEAWSGVLKQTSSVPGGQLFQTLGNYQLLTDDEQHPALYYWTTEQELDPDTGSPLSGKSSTKLQVYRFENGAFTLAP